MANEFIARKGLIVSGSTVVTNAVTASFFVGNGSNLTGIIATSASFATTASYALNANSSITVDTYMFIGNGTTTQYQVSKSYSDSSVTVAVGGLTYVSPDDYSISGTTITFVEAPASQSNVLIKALVNSTTGATGSFSGSFSGIISSASFASTAPYSGLTGVPSGIVSGSTASSPSQGTVRVTINGANTDVDTGLQTGDSPTFAGLTVDTNTLFVNPTTDNVGIGTLSPSASLDIPWSGTSGKPTILLGATDGGATRTDATAKNFRIGAAHYTNSQLPYAILMGNSSNTSNEVRIGGGTGLLNAATSILFYTTGSNTSPQTSHVWQIYGTGIFESNGAQTLRTSTGNLTLATAGGNGNIILSPNGTGTVGIGTSSPGATLHVQGTISSSGNVAVGGNLTVSGLLTAVSTSIQYVTSSQLNVTDNKITVQSNDLVRFGGLSVYDSGSSNATASIYWDSLNHQFIYENLGGSSYNSAILIAGPQNTSTLGNEVGLTTNRIPVAVGTDHIDSRLASSSIRVDFPSRFTHIEAGLHVTGSITSSVGFNGSGTGITGLTNANLSGTAGITNANLANSTISGVSLGSNLNTLTISNPLSGTSYNGSSAVTIALASGYGDTQNPFGSKTANHFLAAPNGSAGAPTFRAIVAADIPTLNQNTTGAAASAGIVTGTTGQILRHDDRIIEPSAITSGYLQFGFTSWANNNTAPYADFLHMRSYTDSSGGNDNLVLFRKDAIGIRVYQQSFGSATAYSTYKDVAFTDSNITGTATNITAYTINQNVGTGNSPSFVTVTSTQATGTAPFTVTSTTAVTNLNADYLDGQHGSYYTTAGNLTGTISSTVLGNSTVYVGTTAIALNRASTSQTLTGVSIDGNAATVSNLTAVQFFNNMGQNHSTRTSFDASSPSYDYGFRYVQGSTNGPGTSGTQFYSWYIGLGNDYPSTGAGSYGAMFAVDRNVSNPYLSVRYNEGNSFGTWKKIHAGYADSAAVWTTARTITIGSTGKSVDGSGNVSWTLAEIGAYSSANPSGYTTNTGTVTSVGGTGTVSGLTLSGTVTTTGNLTLGGTLSVAASNFASQTANTFLAAPNGSAGVPTFRAIAAADVPTLNQNTTGTASNITAYTINQNVGTANNVQHNSLGIGTAASATAGEIRATNEITAYYSDERLKDFHGTITNAGAKVAALNGYYFTENTVAKSLGYNNDKLQVGVSAQEVQAVLPEAVTAAPISDEYLTVRYEKLVPLLIEAIKELQTEVAELKRLR